MARHVITEAAMNMTNETKWTPGPWHTDRPCVTWQNGFGLWTRPVHTSVAGRGFMVAGRTEAEATANARLIAAAPDLYAALRSIVRRHDARAAEMEPGFACGCPDCVDALAALAKVEGR